MENSYIQPLQKTLALSCPECGATLPKYVHPLPLRVSLTDPVTGRQPKSLCVEGLLWQLLLPALHCMGPTRLPTRGSPSALTQLQDAHVQL